MSNKKYTLLFILIVLATAHFLNPMGIIKNLGFSRYICIVFSLFALVTSFLTKKKRVSVNAVPNMFFMLTLFGFVSSLFTANIYHQQSYLDTFMAELQLLLMYLMLFVFIKWDVNKLSILKIVLSFAIIGMIMFVVNRVTYPNMFFGGQSDEEADITRGSLRIGVPFLHCIVLLLFFSIDRWNKNRSKKWFTFMLLSYIVICASLTRQTIVLSTVLGVLLFLKNLSYFKRMVIGIIVIGAMTYFLPRVEFVQTMTEQTQRELNSAGANREYVRITEFYFYTNEAQTNWVTHFFGNGLSHPGSKYGKEMDYNQYELSLWLVDLGWIGYYYVFGLIAAIGLLLLLISAIVRKRSDSEHFVSFWFVYIILTTIVNGIILFPRDVIFVSAMLYFVFGQTNVQIKESTYQKLI